MSLPLLRARIDELVELGVPFELIECEVIDLVDLEDDQRAALWLYAWSLARRPQPAAAPDEPPRPRASTTAMLARLASVAAAIIHLPGI